MMRSLPGGPRSPRTVLAIAFVSFALLATACGRSGSSDQQGASGTDPAVPAACRDAKLEATEIGVSADTITIQVMADVGSPLAPGLFQGNVDAVNAFAKWANANGGVGCRQVKVEVWDSKLDPTEAKNGLINGCRNAVALVGDNALFNPDVATLGNCADKAGQPVGLPNFVGLANDANEQCHPNTWNVQNVSEPCKGTVTGVRELRANGGYYEWLAANLSPDREFHIVPGDLPTTVQSGAVIIAQQQAAGIDVVGSAKVSSSLSQAGYTSILQAIKASGATSVYDGSSSSVMIKAQKEAAAQGVLGNYKWAGSLSIYNKEYSATDPSVTNGTYAGLNQLPWDEAQYSRGLKAYLDNVGGVDHADALGANGFMAAYAFKEVVDGIVAAKGPNAITRSAIIAAMGNHTSDFGGWIGEAKGGKDLMHCYMVMQIQSGTWKRIYPTEAGKLDCDPTKKVAVTIDPQVEGAKIS